MKNYFGIVVSAMIILGILVAGCTSSASSTVTPIAPSSSQPEFNNGDVMGADASSATGITIVSFDSSSNSYTIDDATKNADGTWQISNNPSQRVLPQTVIEKVYPIKIGTISSLSQTSQNVGSSNVERSSLQNTVTQPETINQDFSSMALTINDLPQGSTEYGTPTQNTTTYQAKFVYKSGSTGVPLTFTITKYPSVTDAETTFNQQKSGIAKNMSVTSLTIGDEGFNFQFWSFNVVTFRHGDLIVTLYTYQVMEPVVQVNLQPYAELVNSRITG